MAKKPTRAHCRAIPDKNGQKRGHCTGPPGNISLSNEKTGKIAVNAQGQGRRRTTTAAKVLAAKKPLADPKLVAVARIIQRENQKYKARKAARAARAARDRANEMPRTWNGQFIHDLD